MRPVTIYKRAFCPYCDRALALLKRKGASIIEIDAADPEKRQEMVSRSGRWTFPQIFVGDTHVGGCDDLQALERRGGLDAMLREA